MHITYVLERTTAYIYINGVKAASGNQYGQRNFLRVNNMIGKSNLFSYTMDANLDDISIYSGSLKSNQISYIYNMTYCILTTTSTSTTTSTTTTTTTTSTITL